MNNTLAYSTIFKLRKLFSTFGLPDTLVSDNGPPFASTEFKSFLLNNGIRHLTIAPYHPASNGAAENAVKTVKQALIKANYERQNLDIFLSRFLLDYRNTQHSITNQSPAEAMFGRRLKCRFDLLMPEKNLSIERSQAKQIQNYGGKPRESVSGDKVLVKEYSIPNKSTWEEGTIISKVGNVMYEVESSRDGKSKKRHSDQIKNQVIMGSEPSDENSTDRFNNKQDKIDFSVKNEENENDNNKDIDALIEETPARYNLRPRKNV
ncbi:uncharacterized protein K02A2.6-like isoform X2 [Harmonia axyridis]|uniref:uncharacterized protein K02A2.6-like isoform X1 n=1 Tax=Harmonia axyridis TaxID=115357 RepID=UPI001E276C9C|nr:uncharacterized protein K02A2.6-like isoform X1 [Harmonia axyridis]XP_045481701.1 uncharacterized protein K02A2.6-like isoform X2 [Harmonia axyridis]